MKRGDGLAFLFENTEFALNESGFALHKGLHHSVSRAHVQDLALMGCKSINIELKLGQMVLPRWMRSCTLHTCVMCAALSDPINRVFLTEMLQKVAWVTEPCLRRDQKARHIKQLCKKVLWRIWQWSWREDSNRWKLKRLKSKNSLKKDRRMFSPLVRYKLHIGTCVLESINDHVILESFIIH